MTKKLLLFTAIFSFVVSCTDYEDDFANLNDQLDGISSQLDGIETAVEGIAAIQLEILNINSALDAISTSIGELPTVDDISNLADLINGAIAQLTDLDGDLAALSSQVTAQMSALTDLINNGFSAVDAYLDLIDADIAVIDGVVTDNNNVLTAQQLEIAQILADLGVIQVELDNIDGDNAAILTQLASMLTAINDNFADLSADNQEILADIAGVQAELASQLLIIQALETAISDLQDSVDAHDASVEAQIDALEALISALQEDITVLLESTTTVYNDDLTIKNQAQLDYALSLDDKVMVINGVVDINSAFATGASLDSLNVVMDKMNTITKDVIIASTADLQVTNLKSVGGNYTVTGSNVSDTSLHTVAGDATYSYGTDSYTEANLVHVGGSISIVDNSSATVDFSGLQTLGTAFAVTDGMAVTDTLNDATTVLLGDAIDDTVIAAGGLTLAYSAAVASDVVVTAEGVSFDVTGAQDVTGNVSVDVAALNAAFGNIVGDVMVVSEGALVLAAADITSDSVSLSSDGQDVDVANVVTTTFQIVDTGATATATTDFTYSSVTADSFTITATTDGAGVAMASDNSASATWTDGSTWTVGSTVVNSKAQVTWVHIIPDATCNVALEIIGDVTLKSTDSAVLFDLGWMQGDLTVEAATGAQVLTFQSSIGDSDWSSNGLPDLDGDGSLNWFAVIGGVDIDGGAGNATFENRVCDNANPGTYTASGQIFGGGASVVLNGNNVIYGGGTAYHSFDITAANDINIASSANASNLWIAGGSFTASGFAGTLSLGAAGSEVTLGGTVNVDGTGVFDGAHWKIASYPRYGDVTIKADGGIDIDQATDFGTGGNGPDPDYYTTTLTTTTGDVDIENLVSITGDVSITTGSGAVNAGALATADGEVTISSTSGAIDVSALASHVGDQLTLSSPSGTVDAGTLASSSGNIDVNGATVTLTALATFTTLDVGDATTVALPAYVSGTITLTDATTFSSTSVATADLTADVLENYTLASQVVDLTITGADLPALLSLDVTTADVAPAVGIDLISVTGTTATSITTAGNADVFVVSDNADLTTINAGHANGDDALGSKVHILNNASLTDYTSSTDSLLELRIEGNTAMTTLDLSSYLDAGVATSQATAADLATIDFIFRITDNGVAGTFDPKDNSGTPDTNLVSAELEAEAKAIALHLLGFTQAASVVAEADFVGLTSDADAADIYNSETDFTDGINTTYEWGILN